MLPEPGLHIYPHVMYIARCIVIVTPLPVRNAGMQIIMLGLANHTLATPMFVHLVRQQVVILYLYVIITHSHDIVFGIIIS